MPKYAQRQGGKTGTTYAFKSAISRILEFQNSRIRNPEFWDPGILEFWKWPEKREKMADFPQGNGFLAVAHRLLLRKSFIFPEKLSIVWENPVSGTPLLVLIYYIKK